MEPDLLQYHCLSTSSVTIAAEIFSSISDRKPSPFGAWKRVGYCATVDEPFRPLNLRSFTDDGGCDPESEESVVIPTNSKVVLNMNVLTRPILWVLRK